MENKLNENKKERRSEETNGISKRDECSRGWMNGELALAWHKPVSQIRHYENELARWDPVHIRCIRNAHVSLVEQYESRCSEIFKICYKSSGRE